uniref:BURP domain-containing protein n=1 Tax=Chenopodium quinoa TaxID=63459 RepID=A0A803KX19_CHEQI
MQVVSARDVDFTKKSEFKESDYVFFNYNDLKVGAKMPIYFGGAFDTEIPHFLPKDKAEMIPFSSQKLPFLLNYFGFQPESPQAKAMEYNLKKCEGEIPDAKGAKKCVTSLDSMIDFVRQTFKTSSTNNGGQLFDDLKVVSARDVEFSKKSEFNEADYVFFNYNDLRVGAKMPIYFGGAFDSEVPNFLPKEKADMIPFSSQKLPFLLNYFGFQRESPQAKAMEYSLKKCEGEIPDAQGAKKCVTSLDSMIDFVRETFKISNTGNGGQLFDDVKVLSTSPLPKSAKVFQPYTIIEQPKRVPSPKMTACHMLTYPYAVYYCHNPDPENQVYEITLMGEDGTRVNAVASCHMNSKAFDPNLMVFRMFNTQPGSPVCHFLSSDGLLWVPANPTSL